jgi:hypothetical protein
MNDPHNDPMYQVRDMLAEMVAVGVHAYIADYTARLFTDVMSTEAQDIVADGISRALLKYQEATRSNTAAVIAYNLLDTKGSNEQSRTIQ